DAWAYNSSRTDLASNMSRMISFYNAEAERFDKTNTGLDRKQRAEVVDSFINTNLTSISWTRALKQELVKGRRFEFDPASLVASFYRPFTQQWLYFSRTFNEMVLQMPRIFPDASSPNVAICVKGNWRGEGHFAFISNSPTSDQPDGG